MFDVVDHILKQVVKQKLSPFYDRDTWTKRERQVQKKAKSSSSAHKNVSTFGKRTFRCSVPFFSLPFSWCCQPLLSIKLYFEQFESECMSAEWKICCLLFWQIPIKYRNETHFTWDNADNLQPRNTLDCRCSTKCLRWSNVVEMMRFATCDHYGLVKCIQ